MNFIFNSLYSIYFNLYEIFFKNPINSKLYLEYSLFIFLRIFNLLFYFTRTGFFFWDIVYSFYYNNFLNYCFSNFLKSFKRNLKIKYFLINSLLFYFFFYFLLFLLLLFITFFRKIDLLERLFFFFIISVFNFLEVFIKYYESYINTSLTNNYFKYHRSIKIVFEILFNMYFYFLIEDLSINNYLFFNFFKLFYDLIIIFIFQNSSLFFEEEFIFDKFSFFEIIKIYFESIYKLSKEIRIIFTTFQFFGNSSKERGLLSNYFFPHFSFSYFFTGPFSSYSIYKIKKEFKKDSFESFSFEKKLFKIIKIFLKYFLLLLSFYFSLYFFKIPLFITKSFRLPYLEEKSIWFFLLFILESYFQTHSDILYSFLKEEILKNNNKKNIIFYFINKLIYLEENYFYFIFLSYIFLMNMLCPYYFVLFPFFSTSLKYFLKIIISILYIWNNSENK